MFFVTEGQTERDKLRVIEGLKSALAGAEDGANLEALMSSLTQRVFLMRNVHEDAPVLMKSRWALSFLRGPLTGPEIARAMAGRKAAAPPSASQASAAPTQTAASPETSASASQARPAVGAPTRIETAGRRLPA